MTDKTLLSNLDSYLDGFGFEDEARLEIMRAANVLTKNEAAVSELSGFIESYIGGELKWEDISRRAKEVADECGESRYTFMLIYFASFVPYSLPYFEKVGLGRREWYDSMIDLRWKMNECKRVYGVYGVFTDWFRSFFLATRVAFGRLQFNLKSADVEYKSDRFDIKPKDTVVAVHIPSDTRTPFSAEEREAAYERARRYFSKHFSDGRVVFSCGTWLINPLFNKMLPEGSNLRSFTNEFEIYNIKVATNNLWRLFYVREDYSGDYTDLPEQTSLMRLYKAHLLAGGTMDAGFGFRY